MDKKPFWEMNSSEIQIIDVYEAQIVGEKDEYYLIEFFGESGEIVEAKLKKTEFINFPHPIEIYNNFGIVLFKPRDEQGTLQVGAWPIESYWNISLL